jgi:hypothetical protein
MESAMRIYLYPLLWVCFSSFNPLYAEEKCEWKSWQDLGKAVTQSSPEINVLKGEESYRNTLTDAAGLAPPAVVTGQYTAGGVPWKSSSLEASYLWTIENREKREARLGAARAGIDSIRYEIEDRKATQLLKIALVQQALRRIDSRRDVLLETQSTYKKIIRQFEKRLSLGPEQEASLAVFRIAKKENDLKIESLEVERSQFVYQMASIAGCSELKLPKLTHSSYRGSPNLEKSDSVSTAVKRLEAQAKSLELSFQSEIRSLTPDLSIGPVVIAGRDDEKNRLEIGVAASLPIGGQRQSVLGAGKTAELKARQSEIDLSISRIKIEREAWMDQYRKSIRAMKGGLSTDEIAKTHRKLESLIQGERVSAALVIESHRQLLDHITTFTDLETKATEALWNIRYLDGKIDWSDL